MTGWLRPRAARAPNARSATDVRARARARDLLGPPSRGRRSVLRALAASAGGAVAAACGTVYLNPGDRYEQFPLEHAFRVPLRVEAAARRAHAHLDRCLGHYYRVRSTHSPYAEYHEIAVDHGVGFERTLFLADRIVLLVRIEPASEGAEVSVLGRERTGLFVRALEQALTGSGRACRA